MCLSHKAAWKINGIMHVKHLGQCQIHSNHLLLGALKQRERRGKEERGQERRREEKKKKKRGEEGRENRKTGIQGVQEEKFACLLSATQGKSDWISQLSESWPQDTYSLFWRWSSCLPSLKPLNIGIQWLKRLV